MTEPERVRAHVFLCMLGYYLEWHMRQSLAPMLYDDDDKGAAEALRTSVVAKAFDLLGVEFDAALARDNHFASHFHCRARRFLFGESRPARS
jgi:hypothetical protein